jgi:hypothetical protein
MASGFDIGVPLKQILKNDALLFSNFIAQQLIVATTLPMWEMLQGACRCPRWLPYTVSARFYSVRLEINAQPTPVKWKYLDPRNRITSESFIQSVSASGDFRLATLCPTLPTKENYDSE